MASGTVSRALALATVLVAATTVLAAPVTGLPGPSADLPEARARGILPGVGPAGVAAAAPSPGVATGRFPAGVAAATPCTAPAPSPTRVALRPTQNAPAARGHMDLLPSPSPYGVTVSRDGRTVYDVTIQAETLPARRGLHYVAWATTPELDEVRKLGVLGDDLRAGGRVDWNKFLVLVTAERSADVERWEGPILLTGISPSGLMHTMRGHGIFEAHGVGC